MVAVEASLPGKRSRKSTGLDSDQEKFNNDISTALDYQENIDSMFSTLTNWLEDDTFLIKCLTPTITSISCNTASSSLQNSSILKLLLNTNDLQLGSLGC